MRKNHNKNMLLLSAYILYKTMSETILEQQDKLIHAVLVNKNLKFSLKGLSSASQAVFVHVHFSPDLWVQARLTLFKQEK